ncbi:MAG: glycosyltransferase family 4 protein [Candidatus Eisenbacteria bacterium]|nr:glycosyltransferase family 4 protein [Candidatus Eisenbacteria bacterium]
MSRHLLAINFRDPAHPEAGGAELHLEQVLVDAVRRGWRVTWLAAGFPGGASEGEHKGMRIVRRGTWWNFNFVVPGVLSREYSGTNAPDLIVEDINKAPCFTPWFTRTPVAVIVPHLFGTTVYRETNFVIATYVLALESLIPFAYARCRFVAISESTRDDLVARGIPASGVSVVHCGLDHARYHHDPAVAKSAAPTLTYVGRLRRYKGLDWVLRALPAVRARVPGVKLEIIGDGPYGETLQREIARTGLGDCVAMLGFLPGADKVKRLQASWAVLQPSPKEGWGLTVVESSACGTAVVASDAPGLRDSVRRDETGLLVPYDDTQALADAIVRVLTDAPLRARFEQAGLKWAATFRWDDCGRRTIDALAGEGAA